MMEAFAQQSVWVVEFSRRLFRIPDVAAMPGAWNEIMRDPAQRLELRLESLTAERTAPFEASSENETSAGPGQTRPPQAPEARRLQRNPDSGEKVASQHAPTTFATIGKATSLLHRRSFVARPTEMKKTAVRSASSRAGDESSLKELHDEIAGAWPPVSEQSITEPDTERRSASYEFSRQQLREAEHPSAQFLSQPTPHPLQAGGEIISSPPHRFQPLAEQTGSLENHHIPSTESAAGVLTTVAHERVRLVGEASGLARLLTANITSPSGSARHPASRVGLQSQDPASSSTAAILKPSAVTRPAPSMDEILAELYEQVQLEYLRTYGSPGN